MKNIKIEKTKGDNGWKRIDDRPRVLEENEEIIGRLVRIRASRYGYAYTFENDDGTLDSIFGSTQLENVLLPEVIGQEFKIIYTGKVFSSQGRPVKNYEIYVKEGGDEQKPKEESKTNGAGKGANR